MSRRSEMCVTKDRSNGLECKGFVGSACRPTSRLSELFGDKRLKPSYLTRGNVKMYPQHRINIGTLGIFLKFGREFVCFVRGVILIVRCRCRRGRLPH